MGAHTAHAGALARLVLALSSGRPRARRARASLADRLVDPRRLPLVRGGRAALDALLDAGRLRRLPRGRRAVPRRPHRGVGDAGEDRPRRRGRVEARGSRGARPRAPPSTGAARGSPRPRARERALDVPVPRLRREFPARRIAHGLRRLRRSPRRRARPPRVRPDGRDVAGSLRPAARRGALARRRGRSRRAASGASASTSSRTFRRARIVSKPEGATRLYAGGALGDELALSRLFVKHEGENPTLSFKDRGMTAGVSWAQRLRLPDRRVRLDGRHVRGARRLRRRGARHARASFSCRTRRSRTSSSARRSRTGRRRSASTRTSTAACASSAS